MIIKILTSLFIAAFLIIAIGCERDVDLLEPATYPTFGEVFLDAFVAGLDYSAFGNSKLDAFEIDDVETYKGTSSIKITVPSVSDPSGWYAGGSFYSKFPRDLSGYNALTFWGKASKTAVAEVGFGNDNTGNSLYTASRSNVLFGTSWQKYIIPIPSAEKLTAETGMFWYSAGADVNNGLGHTLWFDEVQYEKLGTIAYPRIIIGDTLLTGPINGVLEVGINGVLFNIDGVDQTVNAAKAYFTLESQYDSIATTTADGIINGVGSGTTKIIVKLGSIAEATITVKIGEEYGPSTPAPTPTVPADSVISLFSNAYTNHSGINWNTHWLYSTAQTAEIQVAGDDVKHYTDLNFVGIEFTSPTVNASGMTHFHMDIWTPDPTIAPAAFKVKLRDFGANGVYDEDGTGDDSFHELTFTASTNPAIATQQWISIDVPLSDFTGLTSQGHLAQLVLSGDIPTVFVDNVYFYEVPSAPTEPTVAAPTPSYSAGDVISIFSDAYTNIAGTNFYPTWGQATVASEVSIGGNNTLLYEGLNYQGIELGSAQDVSGKSNLHVDFWTANSTTLNIYLISTGPVETAYALTVPTTGWTSVDIPLTAFAPVDLADVIQLKFDGNGDIYLDNLLWH